MCREVAGAELTAKVTFAAMDSTQNARFFCYFIGNCCYVVRCYQELPVAVFNKEEIE